MLHPTQSPIPGPAITAPHPCSPLSRCPSDAPPVPPRGGAPRPDAPARPPLCLGAPQPPAQGVQGRFSVGVEVGQGFNGSTAPRQPGDLWCWVGMVLQRLGWWRLAGGGGPTALAPPAFPFGQPLCWVPPAANTTPQRLQRPAAPVFTVVYSGQGVDWLPHLGRGFFCGPAEVQIAKIFFAF